MLARNSRYSSRCAAACSAGSERGSHKFERPVTAPWPRDVQGRREAAFEKLAAGLTSRLVLHAAETTQGLGRDVGGQAVCQKQVANDRESQLAVSQHEPLQFHRQHAVNAVLEALVLRGGQQRLDLARQTARIASWGPNGDDGSNRSKICQKRPISIGYLPFPAINLSTAISRPSEMSAASRRVLSKICKRPLRSSSKPSPIAARASTRASSTSTGKDAGQGSFAAPPLRCFLC